MLSQWYELPSQTRIEVTEEIIREAALYFSNRAQLLVDVLGNASIHVTSRSSFSICNDIATSKCER